MIIIKKALFLFIIIAIGFISFGTSSFAEDGSNNELLYKGKWIYNAEASQKNAKTESGSLAVTHFKNSTFQFYKDGTFLGTSRVKGKFTININNRILVKLPDNKTILFEIDSLDNLVGNMIWREKTLINPTYSLEKKK